MGQSPSNSNTTPTKVASKQSTIKKSHPSKNHNKLSKLPFTVSHWNCASGIRNKLDDIKLAITELKPAVFFISEANRKIHHDDSLIQIYGYNLHNSISLDVHGKSRIIAYTRADCHLKRRKDLESPNAEIIIFDRQLPNIPEGIDRIIGLYRPFTGPDGDKSSGGAWDRYTHLTDTLSAALEGCHRTTILGDFNVDLLKDEEHQGRYNETLKNICSVHSLEQLIHQPTRIQTLKMANGWSIQELSLIHI